MTQFPLYIRVHPQDNVAIVANDGGLPEGATFADGLVLRERVPQGHKVALADLAEGDEVIRYNVAIGYALKNLPKGSWINEHVIACRARRAWRNCRSRPSSRPKCRRSKASPSRVIATPTARLARATSWRSPDRAVCRRSSPRGQRIKAELLPRFPNVDDVVGLEHTYGCGVAIDAPDAMVPIRTLRNISLNPNFGGEVMVVSLGCEKLQPERLMPPGTIPIVTTAVDDVADIGDVGAERGDVVVLQDEEHVGFMSMIESIMAHGRAASRAAERPAARDVSGERPGGRRAVRRQRRVLRA